MIGQWTATTTEEESTLTRSFKVKVSAAARVQSDALGGCGLCGGADGDISQVRSEPSRTSSSSCSSWPDSAAQDMCGSVRNDCLLCGSADSDRRRIRAGCCAGCGSAPDRQGYLNRGGGSAVRTCGSADRLGYLVCGSDRNRCENCGSDRNGAPVKGSARACWLVDGGGRSLSVWRRPRRRTFTHGGAGAGWLGGGGWWLATLVILLSVCCVLASATFGAAGQFEFPAPRQQRHRRAPQDFEITRNGTGICKGSVDIRNGAEDFKRLIGCSVVEGDVQIQLIDEDDHNPIHFQDYALPELREITGYLMLYRVSRLNSLRDIFPNLAVIRGQTLFYNYALVVYQMFHLRELGLTSLTTIERGAVIILNNPYLCFIDTIDWDLIVKAGTSGNYIDENNDPDNCPVCPAYCPVKNDVKLCWTSDHCQKVCLEGCGDKSCFYQSKDGLILQTKDATSLSIPPTCCHEECAGGCTGPGSNQCHVCKNVTHENECRSECPAGMYLFLNRRCVSDYECVRSEIPPSHSSKDDDREGNWKLMKNKDGVLLCVLECEAGYSESNRTINNTLYHECLPCQGTCPKICDGLIVNNIEVAQKLKGCTAIKGNLIVQMTGGDNVVRELEDGLGDIEEIDGYLKVVHSDPLISLNFFKKLRVIHGKIEHDTPEYNGAALIVMYNENLQELWNWKTRMTNLTIANQNLSFAFNPRLCQDKILELREITQANRFPENDISLSSNGDKAICDEQEFKLKSIGVTRSDIHLEWEDFGKYLTDRRALLGYGIFYMEAPHDNLTYYDRRDACGGSMWTIIDIPANQNVGQNEANLHTQPITKLKPYTQYAVFIQTYMVRSSVVGSQKQGRSNIIYVRTKMSNPSTPDNLRVYSISDHEIKIVWKPPVQPHGLVKYYQVLGKINGHDYNYFTTRDYCQENDAYDSKKSEARNNRTSSSSHGNKHSEVKVDPNESKEQCQSSSRDKPTLINDKDRLLKITFENYIQNHVYQKQSYYVFDNGDEDELDGEHTIQADAQIGRRKRRNIDAGQSKMMLEADKKQSTSSTTETWTTTSYAVVDQAASLGETSFDLTTSDTQLRVENLRYFTDFVIEVSACHEFDPVENITLCSPAARTVATTLALAAADDIPSVHVMEESHNSTDSMKIKWEEPKNPNGLIVKYIIEYQRVDPNNGLAPKTECIRRKDYIENNGSAIIRGLLPGNYSIRIQAVSLSKQDRFTNYTYYIIQKPNEPIGNGIIAIIFVLVFAVLAAAVGSAGYFAVKKKKKIMITSINPDYHRYVPDNWETARENVSLLRELGQGAFGMVYEGIVRNLVEGQPEVRCAVKTVNENASKNERVQFLNEASVMKEFSAHHVVKLLGVVSRGEPTLVIMELMANGDLKTYLRSHRPDSEENIEGRQLPTLKSILKMAIEIADGMMYLTERKFVHRDLAARNCMVSEDLTVKVGDFGMTREIYETDYYRKGGQGLLPVRWMAPESLRDGVFTSQCDVWSYGVVLWEMATLASQPYQGLSNEQVLKYVTNAGVMERPEGCPDRLYALMESCWRYLPKQRPTFIDIIEDLLPEVPAQFASVSFYHSDGGVNARGSQKTHHENAYRRMNDAATPLKCDVEDCLTDFERHDSRNSIKESNHLFPIDLHISPNADQSIALDDIDAHDQSRDDAEDHLVPTFFTYNSNGSASNGYVMGIL